MTEEIRLWCIAEGDKLEEIASSSLKLEERLESWIELDISILSPNLLVLGRQVETDFGGVIDLLCLDINGDTVIVELKKDKTPREVTAQALEYASWVRDLDSDRIFSLANSYLAESGPLEDAFMEKFGAELPEVLNENHSILIVGAKIDARSERIITYLSDAYGVNINAATFQYFRRNEGDELLARVFLIEPDKIEYQSRSKRSSKRRRNLTYEELEAIAEENQVGDLYMKIIEGVNQYLRKDTTASSIAFKGEFEGSRKVIFSLIPRESTKEKGLHFQIYMQRFCDFFGFDIEHAVSLLPENRTEWKYYESAGPDYSGYSGYFSSTKEIDVLLSGLGPRS